MVIHCDEMPPKVSALPSVVRMNGVPSYLGAERTGSETSLAFSTMNVFVCSAVYLLPNLYAFMMHWYACFFIPTGIGTSFSKFLRGPSMLA
jgi:hypothetical protein